MQCLTDHNSPRELQRGRLVKKVTTKTEAGGHQTKRGMTVVAIQTDVGKTVISLRVTRGLSP